MVVKVFTSNDCVTASNSALHRLLVTLVEVKDYVTSARTMKCTVLIRGKKINTSCNTENFNTSVNSLHSRADKKLSCTSTGFLRGGANFLLS